MRIAFNQDQLTLWLLLLLPAVFYLHIINANSFNIPYWDDHRNILMFLNRVTATSDLKTTADAWLQPTASHIPLITRSVAWLQVKLTGHINFRWGTILGNLGMVISVYLLVLYLNFKHHFPLDTLLPIPFFLFSISHWASMHFMDPAWQFYWGSTLFPLLVLIAILEQRYILASIAFALAIFTSSGSLALYPLVMLFCLTRKIWRSATGFGLIAGVFFVAFYVLAQRDPGVSESKVLQFNLWQFCKYMTDFMGSLIPDTNWNSQYIQTQHSVVGFIIIAIGLYGTWKIKGAELLKLIFVYTLILACMAFYLRVKTNHFIPSRYSLFSLMATMSICMMFIHHWILKSDGKIATKTRLITLASILVWAFSINQCEVALSHVKMAKFQAVQHYLASGDPKALTEITPNPELSRQELDKAKQSGIFLLEPVDEETPD